MYTHHKNHFWGLFTIPRIEWKAIKEENLDLNRFALSRLGILSAVPAISFMLGLNLVGWSFSGTTFNKIPLSEIVPLAIAFYVLIVTFSLLMGYFTFAMQRAFGTEASTERCLLFMTYTATPMYVAGFIGFIPIVWLVLTVLVASVCYSLYLLYVGIPIYMDIPKGKGLVVSTSIISAGLCALIVFIVATVLVWQSVI